MARRVRQQFFPTWAHPALDSIPTTAELSTAYAAISALRYDPYGRVVDSYPSGGTFANPWRYQGRLDVSPDAANPLYDYGARDYAPSRGVWRHTREPHPGLRHHVLQAREPMGLPALTRPVAALLVAPGDTGAAPVEAGTSR